MGLVVVLGGVKTAPSSDNFSGLRGEEIDTSTKPRTHHHVYTYAESDTLLWRFTVSSIYRDATNPHGVLAEKKTGNGEFLKADPEDFVRFMASHENHGLFRLRMNGNNDFCAIAHTANNLSIKLGLLELKGGTNGDWEGLDCLNPRSNTKPQPPKPIAPQVKLGCCNCA